MKTKAPNLKRTATTKATSKSKVPQHTGLKLLTENDPRTLMQKLEWLQRQFGDLRGWTFAQIEAAIEGTCKLQNDLIDRRHRANVRRLQATVGWYESGYDNGVRIVPIEHAGFRFSSDGLTALDLPPRPTELVLVGDNAHQGQRYVTKQALTGIPLFVMRQIVYALTEPRDASFYVLNQPSDVFFMSEDGYTAVGEFTRCLLDDVVRTSAGLIVPLEIRLYPQSEYAAAQFDQAGIQPPKPGEQPDIFSLLECPDLLPEADEPDLEGLTSLHSLPPLIQRLTRDDEMDALEAMESATRWDRRASAHMALNATKLFL